MLICKNENCRHKDKHIHVSSSEAIVCVFMIAILPFMALLIFLLYADEIFSGVTFVFGEDKNEKDI